ncbi:MAG: RNB domain-containing ribonuclease, partial [Calditrichia bacterium]|nr:RNB domain-containing ribonuclease [Calditrichia bacterium]
MKEISHALHIHKNNYHLFQDTLLELEKQGKIIKLKNKRYAFPSSLQKVKGVIQVTRKGFGFVTDERTGEEIFIPAQHLNTAFDGDTVEVQLFAISRGKSKEGQVNAVIERARQTYVGVFHRSEYYGFLVPDNSRVYRDFYIQPKNDIGAQDGQKVVVEFLKWDTAALNPEGRIIEILGYPDEPGVDIVSVIKGFELPLNFPAKVEAAARKIDFQLSPKIIKNRLDLRKELLFTIDPVDAKDFDDAVTLTTNARGNFLLGVHIADVSHFIPEGSIIDKEALKRGTSIYLVDRVVPMLPEHLSNELCSLQPNEVKLTYSCIM